MTKFKMQLEVVKIINAVTRQGANLFIFEHEKKISKKTKKLLMDSLDSIQESAYKILNNK